MRLIGTVAGERNGAIFSRFLQQKGIAHEVEIHKNTDWGSPSYGTASCIVWIIDEEHLTESLQWFDLFSKDPENALFKESEASLPKELPLAAPAPLPSAPLSGRIAQSSREGSPKKGWGNQPMGWLTGAILAACTLLFFFSHLLIPSSRTADHFAGSLLFTSPLEKAMLYDYPKFYGLIDRFIHLYGFVEFEHPADLPPEGKKLYLQIQQTLFWPGYYELLLKGGWSAVEEGLARYPTFEKLREGQTWRLFSPILLHADLFHLFFNMLWLIVLGKQIEQRLKGLRYVVFILLIAAFSNTAQYLMSGPNFIGFSGVLCGMLAFIWARQKRAAWEGYQLDRLTMIFMLVYVVGMAGVQLFSFFLQKSLEVDLSPNIANMAHLAGGAAGFLMGRLNAFSWRQV